MSGINVNYTNGISFRDGAYATDVGKQIDWIGHSGNSFRINSGGRMNLDSASAAAIDSGGYIRLSAGNSTAAGDATGSVYITASNHITLHAGSNKHVYAGANS
jgi:hypothetical protein